ncbi:hypothetical protein WA016_01478 [Myxococcus stipitatus]
MSRIFPCAIPPPQVLRLSARRWMEDFDVSRDVGNARKGPSGYRLTERLYV